MFAQREVEIQNIQHENVDAETFITFKKYFKSSDVLGYRYIAGMQD